MSDESKAGISSSSGTSPNISPETVVTEPIGSSTTPLVKPKVTRLPPTPTLNQIVLPTFTNGGIEAGISAGNDKITDTGAYLHFRGPLGVSMNMRKFALMRLNLPKSWDDKVKSLYLNMAVYVIQMGLISDESNIIQNSTEPEVNTPDEINELLLIPITEVQMVTLLWATKITFYMINHHVGQKSGELQGYVGKVARAFEMFTLNGIREALWAAGHWIDTKHAMVELELSGVNTSYKSQHLLHQSEDMKMRIMSNPAGTGTLFVFHTVYKLAVKSIYSLFIEVETQIGDIEESIELVKSYPLNFHVGSFFLTGQHVPSYVNWTENYKVNLSAFIHVVMPGSTLASSPSLITKEDIAGSEVYQKLLGFKLAMAKGVDMAIALKIAASRGVGSGGLAVASGFTSLKEIEDARIAVDEEKATGVSSSIPVKRVTVKPGTS